MKKLRVVSAWPGVLIGTVLTVSLAQVPLASAQGGDADRLLKAMSDYVASQKAMSLSDT